MNVAIAGSPATPGGKARIGAAPALVFGLLMNLFERPMAALQRRFGQVNIAYAFLLPNLVIFGLFSFWPSILNIWMSFTGGSSPIVADRPFVGLANYRELLDCASYWEPKTCPVGGYSFWVSLWNTLLFALIQVPVMTVVALATAVVLNRDIRARGFWRAIYFYPVMLSPVVVAIIWDWILKRRGILNDLLVAASGGAFRPVSWLIDETTSWPFFWTVFVYTWAHLGFFMLILLAGLQSIPKDLYEAAELDGTPPWRQFARITLPLLTPTLLVVLVLSLIRAFQVFDEVYVLTGGGPGQATKMMIQHIYETAFSSEAKLFGVAAASSVLLAMIILVLTMLQLRATRASAGDAK